MRNPFDMRLIQRGARLKRSPYFEAMLRAGCRGYTVYNHMFLPICYDDLEVEYEALLNGVTVWDVSVERNRGVVALVGAGIGDDVAAMGCALTALAGMRVHMLSLSATGINLTMVVEGDEVHPLMQRLHAEFFEATD